LTLLAGDELGHLAEKTRATNANASLLEQVEEETDQNQLVRFDWKTAVETRNGGGFTLPSTSPSVLQQ